MEDSSQITQDTTCTAQYNIKTYTISISPNGASGNTKTYTVSHGSKWTVPSCPFSRSGYTFSGYSGGYSVGQSITVTSNISISCQWSIQRYTVYIYPNGVSGSTKTYTVNAGTSWTVPACPFSNSASVFTEYKTGTSSGTSYAVGNKIVVNSNIYLYCQWKLNIKGVTLTAKSGSYAKNEITTQTSSSGSGGAQIKHTCRSSINVTLLANASLTGCAALVGTTNPPASSDTAIVSGNTITRNHTQTFTGSMVGIHNGSFSQIYVKLTSGSTSVVKAVAL